jgi:succinoglycan biosynthesis protein ExoM
MSDHITVCVCTYRRNAMLLKLLRNLALQNMPAGLSYSVVVVDNDAAGSARAEVARFRQDAAIEVAYDIEPERTIPAARNHALRLAKGNFVGIVDDDEFPPPNWLVTLYEAVRTFEVDGALGPVIPFFEQSPPEWLRKSGLYDWPHIPTGTLLNWQQTRTSNVLLKRDVFNRHGILFDESFRTGGSDKAFFRQAMGLGFRFVAVAEAPVYEIIPPERWTKAYFVRRALVNGFNSQKYVAGDPHRFRLIAATIKSSAAAIIYAISAPVCALLGQHVLMNCLERGAYHLSRAAAAFGFELRKKRDF